MGKSARLQTWSYTGTNFDQLLAAIGMLGRSAPKNLVSGHKFDDHIDADLHVSLEVSGYWKLTEHRDDNVMIPTKDELEAEGIKVTKLA